MVSEERRERPRGDARIDEREEGQRLARRALRPLRLERVQVDQSGAELQGGDDAVLRPAVAFPQEGGGAGGEGGGVVDGPTTLAAWQHIAVAHPRKSPSGVSSSASRTWPPRRRCACLT